jgi:SAM-dependent methyltransferase
MVAQNIAKALADHGVLLLPGAVVHDFGCGSGRILRYLHPILEGVRFIGTDIDEEAIQWCSDELAHLGWFQTNPHRPRLPFAAASCDLVYAISVFTHLPEEMQFAWLQELQRIVKPGGHVLLTAHGEGLFRRHIKDPEALARFESSGFHYVRFGDTDGLPAFYQTAFHSDEYLRREWGRYFEVIVVESRGIANNQDLVLCKRT